MYTMILIKGKKRMKFNTVKRYTKALFPLFFLFGLSTLSYGAGMSNQGVSLARSIMNWLYTIAGVGSTIYLLVILFKIKAQYAGWNDFFQGCVLVIVIGAVLLVGDYLFVYGGSGAN